MSSMKKTSKRLTQPSEEFLLFQKTIDGIAESDSPWRLDGVEVDALTNGVLSSTETKLLKAQLEEKKKEIAKGILRYELTRFAMGEQDTLGYDSRENVRTLGRYRKEMEEKAKSLKVPLKTNPYQNTAQQVMFSQQQGQAQLEAMRQAMTNQYNQISPDEIAFQERLIRKKYGI